MHANGRVELCETACREPVLQAPEPVALLEVDGVCASGERVWRLLLSMKGLCHVELAETSPNRASHRRVGNGFEGDATRRRKRFFDYASAFAEDGLRRTSRYAQNDSRRACGLSRCPGRPGVRQRSPFKNIGVFESNMEDYNSPPSFQPLLTHLSNSYYGLLFRIAARQGRLALPIFRSNSGVRVVGRTVPVSRRGHNENCCTHLSNSAIGSKCLDI